MEAKRAVQTLLLIALAVVLISGMAYAGVAVTLPLRRKNVWSATANRRSS